MSRLGISGIALPAMPCRSPTIPTVRVDNRQDLRLPLRPLLAHKFPLPVEVFAHVVEFLDHGFDALSETTTVDSGSAWIATRRDGALKQ